MIDCHSHLADEAFKEDIDDVVARAIAAGVKQAIVVPEGEFQFRDVIELHQRHPEFILPGLGIHPVQMGESGNFDRSALLSDWTPQVIASIQQHKASICCIGECGLDFTPYYIKSAGDKDEQRQVFKHQVDLATQLGLPLNVHSRSAGKHVIDLLANAGAKKVLLHAFDAKVSTALKGVELGYFFSIPPSVVRSPQKQKLVEKIPMENLLLETDSPALGPEKQVGRGEMSLPTSTYHVSI
ncbi:putative deoxyribonuclease TATDN3 isoform X2 [Watersipora subatra]|uniref:putative deoxyribonuclease TATDN3 isoform X2 n=1 Tax=Watersipora subatra TaxID=2589382 RepID=UPI00355AD98B